MSNKGQISFCPIHSQKSSIPMCLCLKTTIFEFSYKGYQLSDDVPPALSSFLLAVTSNKGGNNGKISCFQLTPEKCRFPCIFAQKLRLLSTHNFIRLSTFFLPVSSNKGQISFCPIYSQIVSIPMRCCPKVTIFESL